MLKEIETLKEYTKLHSDSGTLYKHLRVKEEFKNQLPTGGRKKDGG